MKSHEITTARRDYLDTVAEKNSWTFARRNVLDAVKRADRAGEMERVHQGRLLLTQLDDVIDGLRGES